MDHGLDASVASTGLASPWLPCLHGKMLRAASLDSLGQRTLRSDNDLRRRCLAPARIAL
jgi:hypothetical protein